MNISSLERDSTEMVLKLEILTYCCYFGVLIERLSMQVSILKELAANNLLANLTQT